MGLKLMPQHFSAAAMIARLPKVYFCLRYGPCLRLPGIKIKSFFEFLSFKNYRGASKLRCCPHRWNTFLCEDG